jgi:hypothetical protein
VRLAAGCVVDGGDRCRLLDLFIPPCSTDPSLRKLLCRVARSKEFAAIYAAAAAQACASPSPGWSRPSSACLWCAKLGSGRSGACDGVSKVGKGLARKGVDDVDVCIVVVMLVRCALIHALSVRLSMRFAADAT